VPLDESGLFVQNRTANLTAGLSGVGTGLAVAVAIALLLGLRSWYRWRLLVGLCLAALIAAPLGIGSGLLYNHQLRPYLTESFPNYYDRKIEYHFWTGQLTGEAQYQRAQTFTMANALLIGISTGVVLLFCLTLAFQWLYVRRVRAAGVAVEEQARRTAEAFPELAAAGGGVEGLSRPGSARQLLAAMGEAV
jgi:low affinity Fe/Cu permease